MEVIGVLRDCHKNGMGLCRVKCVKVSDSAQSGHM